MEEVFAFRPIGRVRSAIDSLEEAPRQGALAGMDAIDGTPVLDIKPHSPELDG